MITTKEIIRKYVGVPFKHGGRDMSGVDCWGLAILVYRDLGFALWDINEEYDSKWSFEGRDHFAENYHREWVKVDRPDIFDGVLFKNKCGVSNHGGIFVGDGKFLHSARHTGVAIERLTHPVWSVRLDAYYHLKVRDKNDDR